MKTFLEISARAMASMLAVALLIALIYGSDTNASQPLQDGIDSHLVTGDSH